jgi:fructosamine-3-kinase
MGSEALADAVGRALGVAVTSTAPVPGGCISDAGRVALADGRVVFAKAAAGLPEDLLAVEAEGLSWLRAAGAVRVPEVLALTGEALVLEWVEPGARTGRTDESLGRGLAGLHRAGAEAFGWHRDGFIGRLPQCNTPPVADPGPDGADGWPAFWIDRRIVPLTHMARDRKAVDDRVPALVDRLAARIAEVAGPPEPPARLHGDLWSGNVHVDARGEPWLVDPAAYGGHREVDLAMLHLFGSPSPAFAAAYHEVHPLADGWRDRLRLWQLEPLLTHAVMFGGGYGASVRAVLDQYT